MSLDQYYPINRQKAIDEVINYTLLLTSNCIKYSLAVREGCCQTEELSERDTLHYYNITSRFALSKHVKQLKNSYIIDWKGL